MMMVFSCTPPGLSPSTGASCCRACGIRVLEARSQLERQCVKLCDLVCAARARRGDLAGAVRDAARRRIQLQPLEEAGYRTLMQLQADLGDRAGAVSTYHHCASVLERELAITPNPATRQAFERLMARSGPTRQVRGCRTSGLAIARSGIAAARMVGRSSEFSVLEKLWRGAVAGDPRLVVVRGGSGVGKTRLVTEVARLARRQGAVVAGSQCFGTAGRLALAPVADWLRNPAVQAATGDPGRGLACRGGPAGAGRGTGGARRRPAERWSTPGSACASSKAWPGHCWPSAARCCWSWTTCSGATRRPWPSSRLPRAGPRRAAPGGRRRYAMTTRVPSWCLVDWTDRCGPPGC